MPDLPNNEIYTLAKAGVEDAALADTKHEHRLGRGSIDANAMSSEDSLTSYDVTEEDLRTLRRVSGKIPWPAFTVAFVELCERFSYYGTTVVCEYSDPARPHPPR